MLIEYLVNTYTFALPIELLLVPMLAVIAMLDAVARTDAKYSAVAKLTMGLQTLFGLAIVVFAIHKAVSYRDTFQTLDALRAIALVPVLSILFIPCIYVLFLVSSYEQLFLRLKLGPQKDPRLVRYARYRLIRHLGLHPQRVRAFTRAHVLDLMQANTRVEVDKLMEPRAGTGASETS